MHICLDFRPALRQGTGVGTYVRNLVEALSHEFPDDRYTAFSASWKDRLNGLGNAAAVEVSDWRIPVRILDRAWHRWSWPRIEQLIGPVDVAHSPSPMLLPTRHAKTVVTVHDCYFMRHPEDVFGPVRRDYVPLARASAQSADAVAVVSVSAAAEAQEFLGVPRERIVITPLGVQPIFFAPPAATEVLEAHGIDGPFMLFVGRRERRKDLGSLFAASDALAAAGYDLHIVLVGPRAPGWDETWAAASTDARARTTLLEHQPVADLAALYGAASLVVLPSRWEGFGLPGLEAMAAGTPVIATDAGSLPEVLADAALYAAAENPAELADRCRTVLEDSQLANDLSERGRKHAATFRWSDTAQRTHALYRQLLG